jgi:hypothetical protein
MGSWPLMIERKPAFTSTPLPTNDKDIPDKSIILMGDKLETASCLELNKDLLVVCILGQLVLGGLIIKGILILKPGLVLRRCRSCSLEKYTKDPVLLLNPPTRSGPDAHGFFGTDEFQMFVATLH